MQVEAVLKAEGKRGFSVTHSALYTVYGNGSIAVDNAVTPEGRRIPLARLGVRLLLNPGLDQFTYLGRGPMENYADRKRGFDLGLYRSSVREQMTPYAKPMECGNHEDVRWAALSGSGLPTLMAQADGGSLQASALPYTDEVMTPIEYTIDLPGSTNTVLVLAARTLGVGSNGCGPRPLDPYIVWSEPAAFSYVLRLLPSGQKELPAIGRMAAPQNRIKPVVGSRSAGGQVSLTCATPGARIEYSADGAAWQVYNGPFDFAGGNLALRASAEGSLPFQGGLVLDEAKGRTHGKWTIVAASSFTSPIDAGRGAPGGGGKFCATNGRYNSRISSSVRASPAPTTMRSGYSESATAQPSRRNSGLLATPKSIPRWPAGLASAMPSRTSVSTRFPDPTGTVDLLTTTRYREPSMAAPMPCAAALR